MRITSLAWGAFVASLFQPFISFVAYNQSDLTNEQTIMVALLFGAYTACICLVLAAMSRIAKQSFSRLLLAAALLNIALFNYDSWLTLWTHRNEVWEPFIIFIVACSIALFLLLRYGQPRVLAQLTIVFALGASILPAYRYSAFTLASWQQSSALPHSPTTPAQAAQQPLPNIYHVMMDGYAHHSVLNKLGLDTAPFRTSLAQRGFYMVPHAHANYPLTRYSVTAMQAMDYLFTPGIQMPLNISSYYRQMRGDNAATAAYKARGYRYAYADNTRYNPRLSCPENADICLRKEKDLQLAWRSILTPLLKKTPAYNFIRLLHGGLSVREVTHMLDEIPQHEERPFYLFAMTLPPHYPYMFRADCSLRHPEGHSYARFDAEGDVQGYLDNVSCTNVMLNDMLDKIITRDPNAIILLHSDHGSSFSFKKPLPCPHCMSDKQMAERYPIFAALRLPKHCQKGVPSTLSPVNFHRAILACLDNKPAELLPDTSFINWYPFAYGGGDMFVYEKNHEGQRPLDVSPARPQH